ncbi:protein Shroom4-like [Pollicipes pollicipes]|uniref:protein Shroom4-like n=1 Tax=Pollicipes pollicipes TaxID=41117 RepID=UPI0018854B66|nr:protein Shroom4-like [Pollicipes pollicipes]
MPSRSADVGDERTAMLLHLRQLDLALARPTPPGLIRSESAPSSAAAHSVTDDTPSPVRSPVGSAPLTPLSPEALLLTQFWQELSPDQGLNGLPDVQDIRRRKSELLSRISSRLAGLREAQRAVEDETATNAALGAAVAARVEQLARPSEAARFRTCVEQIGTITRLLLGLGGRLARAQATLAALPESCVEEKAHLTNKRDKLRSQLGEARVLEEEVSHRRRQVDTCLERYLSADELAEYQHFVQMKAKLIVDAREIEDKIRVGEEQLAALTRAAGAV